jgi:transposase
MRPYSVDFRQKIIDVWEKERISIRELAKRFNVAKSFIQKLLKQYQETGDIRPRPQGGSPPTKLNSEQLVILVEIIEANRDATLQELSNLLSEKTQIKVSRSTLGRITKKLKQSFPKKRPTSPKKSEKK